MDTGEFINGFGFIILRNLRYVMATECNVANESSTMSYFERLFLDGSCERRHRPNSERGKSFDRLNRKKATVGVEIAKRSLNLKA